MIDCIFNYITSDNEVKLYDIYNYINDNFEDDFFREWDLYIRRIRNRGFYENKLIKVVSDEGVYEYRKIIALKKFLKDFSILAQRTPSYSKILEDYVVYANIFNIQK